MKYIFFLLFLGPANLYAQSSESQTSDQTDKLFYTVVDQMPSPVDGMENLYAWVSKNVRYPASAWKAGEHGTVFVGFVVRKDGSITDIKTVKGVSPALDREAERVIGLMEKWKPGTLKGKPVHVKYVMPIKFKLANIPGDTEAVFVIVDQMPEHPGGLKALKKYIEKSIQYPRDVKKGEVNKTVLVEFIVEKDGSRTEVKVSESASPSLDAEALRVVNSLPKWKAGKLNGTKVRVRVAVPIEFK